MLLELGVDPKPVIASAGITPELLRNDENLISFVQVGRLIEAAEAASGCPHIGLLVGLRGGLHSHGLVGRLMATAPTVRDAVVDLCVNQVRFVTGAVAHFTVQSGGGVWGYTVQGSEIQGFTGIQDGALGHGIALIRDLCGASPEEVRFSRSAPADSSGYRQALKIPFVFDAEQSCLVLPASVLDAPVVTADPVARRILQRQVQAYWARRQPSVAEQVRRLLAALVTGGDPTLERAALALDVSPRTLNRRLQDEGTSFRAVLDQARHDVACQLLSATSISITEIGMALGYASPPGFVRAFRRIAGRAPSDWRRARAHGPVRTPAGSSGGVDAVR